jgi:hypothetical protein
MKKRIVGGLWGLAVIYSLLSSWMSASYLIRSLSRTYAPPSPWRDVVEGTQMICVVALLASALTVIGAFLFFSRWVPDMDGRRLFFVSASLHAFAFLGFCISSNA